MKNFFQRMGSGIKRHKGIVVLLIVLAAAGTAAGIMVPRFLKPNSGREKTVRQTTIQLEKMDLTRSVSATGTIESAKTKKVSAKASNVEIKRVKAAVGDSVKKGQTLVDFDKSDLQSSLTEARENLADARSQASAELTSANRKLSEARSTYASQKKKLAASVSSAKKKYEKAKKAFKTASPAEKQKAQQELSQAKTAYEQAKSEQENMNRQNKNSVESAQDAVTNARTNSKKSLREAKKSVNEAKKLINACKVKAPMSGIVTAVGVEDGDNYSGGDMFEISDCTNLQVSTTVSEYDITDIKKGQRVVILTDATGDDEIEGTITYVAMTTGNGSLSTGSGTGNTGSDMSGSSTSSDGYEVRIKISEKNDKLRIGMTAKCSIILEEAGGVYAAPYDAIHENTNGDSVLYVLDSESGARSEVTVTKGMESDYYVEVSGDGLREGLRILLPSDEVSADPSSDKANNSDGAFSGFMDGMSPGNKMNRGGPGGMPGGAPGGAPGAPGM